MAGYPTQVADVRRAEDRPSSSAIIPKGASLRFRQRAACRQRYLKQELGMGPRRVESFLASGAPQGMPVQNHHFTASPTGQSSQANADIDVLRCIQHLVVSSQLTKCSCLAKQEPARCEFPEAAETVGSNRRAKPRQLPARTKDKDVLRAQDAIPDDGRKRLACASYRKSPRGR